MKRSTKIHVRHLWASMLFYPAALPLSAQTLTYVVGIIRRHRRQIGSAWTASPTAELACLLRPDKFSYLVRVDRSDP
jgi:hypothetical protein